MSCMDFISLLKVFIIQNLKRSQRLFHPKKRTHRKNAGFLTKNNRLDLKTYQG